MYNSILMRPIEILLVEDKNEDVLLTKEAFKNGKLSNNLNFVTNGEDAIKYLLKMGKYEFSVSPDIVLLDLNLPLKSGLEVLAEIKENEILKKIPVVILTSSDEENDISSSYLNHANCFINKPIDFIQFLNVVTQIETFWFSIVRLPNFN